jgi:hypothetical protein
LISFVRHEKFSARDPKMFRLTGAWVKKDPWPLLRAQDHKHSIKEAF